MPDINDTYILTLQPPERPKRYRGVHREPEPGEVPESAIISIMVGTLLLAGVLVLATASRFGINPMDFNPFSYNPFN
jgi:archaellum biogenesis protein FlaJ (TadC family)